MALSVRRWLRLGVTGLSLALIGIWWFAGDAGSSDSAITAVVQRGDFAVTVATAGELRAREDVKITGPPNTQQAEVYQMRIASIVPEGTVVKAGDVVAELDRSTLATKLAEVTLNLSKAEAVYEQAMLDSTLNLSKAREELRTLELALEEKKLAKEQAVYEAPTIRRQAEIDHEKAERALAQAKVDLKTKTEQAQAKMREVGADLERQKNKLAIVQGVMAGFTIRAPAPGMVIYVKEWNGRKRTTGSQVSAWDPTVATLPDLTQMESVTYVNEIDVRKVAVDQPVTLTLDADPTKQLTGKVTGVANVGEQRPNTDAKVFEVRIQVAESDTTLRPGMTTGNVIEAARIPNVLFVPLDAVDGEDGVAFVFKQSGGRVVKQEVATGTMNDDEVVILQGLDEGERVLLTPPANKAELELVRLPGSAERPAGATGDTGTTTVPLTSPAEPGPKPAAAKPSPSRRTPS
ncbi:MAG: efflux RND transporter periplasmic adaptor subunit [Gemmatimonadales bacterium]